MGLYWSEALPCSTAGRNNTETKMQPKCCVPVVTAAFIPVLNVFEPWKKKRGLGCALIQLCVWEPSELVCRHCCVHQGNSPSGLVPLPHFDRHQMLQGRCIELSCGFLSCPEVPSSAQQLEIPYGARHLTVARCAYFHNEHGAETAR